MLDRIHQAVIRNPSIVQAAEGGASFAQDLMYRVLNRCRVAPPYWRYLPNMLAFPPLRYLRGKYPSVVAGNSQMVLCET